MKKRAASLAMALIMALSLLPAAALAAEDTLQVQTSDFVQIGENEDMEATVYLYETAIEAGITQVAFTDFEETMEEGMIASLGNAYVEGTHIAPLSPAYQIAEADEDWTLEEDYEEYDFSGCYAYWIMDDDYEMYFFVIHNTAEAEETQPEPVPAPVVKAGGKTLQPCTVTEDGYSYTDWMNTTSVRTLYTYAVPVGTDTVQLEFGRNCLAYNYKSADSTDDDYLAGIVEDYMTGADHCTVQVDSNGDGVMDYIQVQTPYDAYWNTELLYAIAFVYEVPYAKVNGTVLQDVSVTEDGYRYTDWQGVTAAADLYTVTIPDDTAEVELFFGQNCLAYNYKSADSTDDDYLAGIVEDYMTGADHCTVQVDSNGDGVLDYIQVQTPYDAYWNTELLYAITFRYENGPQTPGTGEDTETLPAEDDVDAWIALGIREAQSKLSQKTGYGLEDSRALYAMLRSGASVEQSVLDAYAAEAAAASWNADTKPTDLARAALALAIQGKDITDVSGVNLAALLWNSARLEEGSNELVYTLLALDACNTAIPEDAAWSREAMVAALLDFQTESGSFARVAGDNDTYAADYTAMALMALAPYREQTAAADAAAKAEAYLKTAMTAEGYGNVYSDAQVLLGLASVGIDPANSDFGTAVDNLATKLVKNYCVANGGFTSDMAAYQALEGLEAVRRLRAGEDAYWDLQNGNDPSDDSGNTNTGSGSSGSGSSGSGSSSKPETTITVKFTLLGDTAHGQSGTVHTYAAGNLTTWIAGKRYTVPADAVVMDVVEKALTENSVTWTNRGGYLAAVNGLGEYDNGSYSGWMYTLNGSYPNYGMAEQKLENGDVIVLHYSDDYRLEDSSETVPKGDSPETAPEADVAFTDVPADTYYHDAVYWAAEQKITTGVTETEFCPDGTATQAQILTFLWRASGCPETETTADAEHYYDQAAAWAQESGLLTEAFAADQPFTRAQVMLLLFRSNGAAAKPGRENPFIDLPTGNPCTEAVLWAYEQGITKGTTAETFSPDEPCTRSQLITFLYRASLKN